MNWTYEDLLKKINYLKEEEISQVKKAYTFASYAHYNQFRESGEPYIIHPINVACIIADLHSDVNTIIASLLHDVVEDTKVSLEEITEQFNPTVANLVNGVTKLTIMEYETEEENKNANLRKIIMSFRNDVRIILIKLADRLHNMRTLQYKNPRKRRMKSLETMDIYVPLAYFIGAYNFKCELEDLALKYLMPSVYSETVKFRDDYLQKYQKTIMEMINVLSCYLQNENISNYIEVNVKNISGINKRILDRSNRNNIHDLISLKIIVVELIDCYTTLGIVHNIYKPIISEFKDFISIPKTNMYRSLHTSVLGPNGKIIQNQIRTKEMDIVDTYGIAAYFQLIKDDTSVKMQHDLEEKFQFYKSLTEIDDAYFDNKDFVNQVNKELLGKKIYVYNSNGIAIELPVGSTVIDFAYKIDSQKANHLEKVIVNNIEVGFDYVLKDADIVNLYYNKELELLDENWLDLAHITIAKRKILENLSKN